MEEGTKTCDIPKLQQVNDSILSAVKRLREINAKNGNSLDKIFGNFNLKNEDRDQDKRKEPNGAIEHLTQSTHELHVALDVAEHQSSMLNNLA